jgi:hypothetical protein
MSDPINRAAVTAATVQLIKASQQENLGKAWTQSGTATSGITEYDLEAGAKLLFPVITPLLKRIPRVSGKGGIQANWRGITAINSAGISAGVGQGNRGGITTTTTKDYIAAYRTLGYDDNVSFEADLAAAGFDDLRSINVTNLLKSIMIGEERTVLGGNSSLALGTTPTPTLVGSTTGGTLAAQTWSVVCVALAFDGYRNAGGAGSLSGVVGAVTRTNADSSTDTYGGGAAQKSAAATATTTGSTGSIAATVAAVRGAVGYAWYWGTSGSEALGAVTSINSVSITAAATGTQTITAAALTADNSQNTLVYDGLLTQIGTAANNSYYTAMPTGTAGTGTPLTSDSAGGIVEIDVALKAFWDNYRLTPTDIYVSSQEMTNISKKVLSASSTSAQRFVFNSEQGVLAGGTMVRSYLNKYAMDGAAEIPIRLHPEMPAGTIMFFCDTLPYPLSNVSNVLQIRTRRDYYQIEYPLRSRKYEYGVYVDSVLQNYFPPAFGMISNIANG